MSFSFCLDINNNTSLFAKQINGFSSPILPSNGFSIRPVIVPIFAFSPKNTKFNRTQFLFRANSSQSVGFEVKFKPNFDDYLKAMESVKTVRERRSKNKTEGQNSNLGDSVRDDRKVARGENEKWIKDHSNKVVKDTGFNRDDRKFVHGENVKWIKDHRNTVVKDTGLNQDNSRVVYGDNVRWIKDRSITTEEDKGTIHNSVRTENYKNNTGEEDHGNHERFVRNSAHKERKFVYGKNERWVKDKSYSEEGNGYSRGSAYDTIRGERNSLCGKNERWAKDKGYSKEGNWDSRVSFRNSIRDKGEIVHDKNSRGSAYDTIRGERNSLYGKNERWAKDKGYSKEGNWDSRVSFRNSIRDKGEIVHDKNSRGSAYDTIRGERNSLCGKNERWAKDKGYSKEGNWDSRVSFRNSIRDKGEIVHDKNVRWVKNKGKISDEDYEGYSSGDENRKVNERKVWHAKDVRGSKYNGNGGVKDEVNGGSFRNWNRNEPSVKESKFGVKSTKQFDTHGRNVRWEEKHGNNTFVKEKDYGFKVGEDRINGSEIMFGRNARWEENQAKWDSSIEKDRFLRVDKDKVRGRNKYGVEESDGDEEVGSERSAFKPMGGVDDVVDKPRISRNEMEDRIQKLARSLHGADVNMPEWMFSKMIRSARIRFSDHSILRIVQLLGKLGNWRRVLQLIDWLQSRERFNSHKLRFIYTTALSVLGKAKRPVEALNLFLTMQQQFSTYPDLVAYHSIAVTLGQAGHMRELFEVIDIMKSPPKKKFKNGILEKWDPRLEPDIVVYNAVLNACVKRKQWEGAFWVLQQLQDKGQHPSGSTYGLVMEIMLACGKYNLVHDFYKKVLKSTIPNAITYKVLVNTLWREGKADEAVLAVEDMEKRGVVGSAALYYDLARCLCSAGRCQEALTQVEKICRVANKPLVVTYTGLMQACLDAGNIEDGTYIYRHMQKFCSPNLVTCNIILKAYIEYGKFEEAKILFHKLFEDGKLVNSREDYKERVIPDTYTFNTMLDACIEEKRWDEFEFVFKGMLEYGHPFNAKRHLRMILDAGRAGKGELLETTWNYLIRNSQIPLPHSLLKEMFCIKLEQGKYAVALSYISNHNPTNIKVFSSNSWLNFFKENAHRLQKDCLLGLVHEVSLLTSESDSQNLVLQNLGLACTEFLKMRISVSQTDRIETQTVLC